MEEEVEVEKAEPVGCSSQPGAGGDEATVYCAVGKEAGREWKANLLWVLAHRPRTKRLVFVHCHRLASRINMMGAWVPVSQLAHQEVTAYRRLEEEKMGKVLDDLLNICKSQKVSASKIIIASDDTAKGLVQFVDDHGVTELVMGAASDRAYHRKMRAPRSKKALMVQRRANPACKIWFVCKGNLICTREASEGVHNRAEEESPTASTSPRSSTSDLSRSKSSPRLHSDIFNTLEPNEPTTSSIDQPPTGEDNVMDRNTEDLSHQATGAAGCSMPSTSETVGPEEETDGLHLVREVDEDQEIPSPDGSDDGEMDAALYEKLKDALMEAENLKREAYEETRRRQMAERDLAEANKMADEAERWYQREAKLRKEVEAMVAREQAEMERGRQELDGMLEQMHKADDRSAELEVQIASSERMMSDLEAKLSESYAVLDALRRERQQQRHAGIATEAEAEDGDDHTSRSCLSRLGYSELAEATNSFDESVRIDAGDGGRGRVYRGELRGVAAAVKVFDRDAAVDEARFGRAAEAIGAARHPGLVALVGACPEARALVYELVPGGSLEEHLDALPWHARCAVAHAACAALSFLHTTMATVHGDVRPATILLDQMMSSCKLAGLGTRRLLEEEEEGLAMAMAMARRSTRGSSRAAAAYADPRWLATGELTPRCDVHALGVVLLRLVTGMPPFLARKAAHQAAAGAKPWHEVVDHAWPIERATEVALLGLECCDTDRSPAELLEEAMTVLQDAMSAAPGRSPSDADAAPSYFLCPILKEVMRDPHIAGDGFSYEAEAIREWLHSGHDTSPMTNLKLPTRDLMPNHALRSAIHQWRQRHGRRLR